MELGARGTSALRGFTSVFAILEFRRFRKGSA